MTHLSFRGGGYGVPRDDECRYGDGTKMQGRRSAGKKRHEEAAEGEMTPCCPNTLMTPHPMGEPEIKSDLGATYPHDLWVVLIHVLHARESRPSYRKRHMPTCFQSLCWRNGSDKR